MKILFLAPYPAYESPSQRYRFEHYLPLLAGYKISYEYKVFLSRKAWDIFFVQGHFFRKLSGLISGYLRRFMLMFTIGKYDFVYIHREAAPLGPPVFEWIIAKLFRKKIIYDFDDAIWIPIASEHNKFALRLKWFSKVRRVCRWSYKISAGNEFLAEFARNYNKQVFTIPTVVDTEHVHKRKKDQRSGRLVVGWTGTFTTLKYLAIVVPALKRLQEKIDFLFLVIANTDPQLPLKNYRFIQWQKESEIDDLLNMNVGLMPLWDNPVEHGKCGFKAIQYMALGIPAVVSDVGVNGKIVGHGIHGYTCKTDEEWESSIEKLLIDEELRTKMGEAGRKKIEEHYSVHATKDLFLRLFMHPAGKQENEIL